MGIGLVPDTPLIINYRTEAVVDRRAGPLPALPPFFPNAYHHLLPEHIRHTIRATIVAPTSRVFEGEGRMRQGHVATSKTIGDFNPCS